MRKNKQIEKLQKMCQEYSDLVDKDHEIIDSLVSMIGRIEEQNRDNQNLTIDFEKDEDPIEQLAKMLVSLSDVDWDKLGSEVRIHLLNEHSTDWVRHPRIAGKFSSIESIVMSIYEVERGRRIDGSL